MKLQLWDTAGQERFRSVTRSYFRGAAGALLVYDITKFSPLPRNHPLVRLALSVRFILLGLWLTCSRESFLALQTWLVDCRALASPDIVIILVGNKSDLSNPKTSLTTDIRTFANGEFRGGEVTGGFRREREVSVEEAGRWASREGIGFLEASALDGTNVDEAFLRCARQILTKVELGTTNCTPFSSPRSWFCARATNSLRRRD